MFDLVEERRKYEAAQNYANRGKMAKVFFGVFVTFVELKLDC